MNQQQAYIADRLSSPGDSIRSILKNRNMSLAELSSKVGPDIISIVNDCAPIGGEIAKKIEKCLGGNANFWMRRDEIFQSQKSLPNVPSEIDWVKEFPYADIAKLGWFPSSRKVDEKLDNLYNFFDCDNVREWISQYSSTIERVAFRTSFTFENDTPATVAWLRMGELASESIEADVFNPDLLAQKVSELKPLCRKSDPADFLPELQRIFAETGVKFVVVRSPKGCRASGATQIDKNGGAIIQLSFRYLSDDHFWFTLFHEVAHLVLHRDTKLFLEGSFVEESEMETEANEYSSNLLIPEAERVNLRTMSINRKSIIRMAFKLGISAGILVGQMQHMGIIPASKMNFFKRRYTWS